MSDKDPVLDIFKKNRKVIELFYAEVCRMAEQKMLVTGKLEGAHYVSMNQIIYLLKEQDPE